jgi:hypothetical protein
MNTWKFPIHVPGHKRMTCNLVSSAIKRFPEAVLRLPMSERGKVWKRIAEKARTLGFDYVPDRMPQPVKPAPPEQAEPPRAKTPAKTPETLATLAEKEARADASLRCERLLEAMGFSESEGTE